MLAREHSALVLVDVQGKLAQSMVDSAGLIARLSALIEGMKILQVPIFWVEQYPQGLGPTHPQLHALLQPFPCYQKMSFGIGGVPELMSAIADSGRHQLLICGIEAHVCVYQSARQLLSAGYDVEVVADGVSSRTEQNRQIGLAKMQSLGAKLTSVEMALFELVASCDDPAFKRILGLVK
ncbi:isochorismatase family protein [Ferrimonas pelagia]|uniref:Isochorismatase family protein n=1 Tax=Ferrimonas pelagia TaxID=1177826 RepID=A0ABP9EPA6_9GAMM